MCAIDRHEWDALVRRSSTATAFQTYGWQLAWWETHGRSAEPLLLEARTNSGELVGIAPLMIEDRTLLGRRLRTVRFAGHGLLNYGDFVLSESPVDVLRVFVDWLVEHRSIWAELRFGRILDTSPTYESLGHVLAGRAVRSVRRRDLESPELVLGEDPARDRQLLRKQGMQNKLNRLRRQGDVAFERLADADSILPMLPLFFEQHVRRRSSDPDGASSPFVDPTRREFVRRLVELSAPAGGVLLDVLRFDGRPIAFNFLLADPDARRHVLVLLTFEIDAARESPGLLLLRFTLEATMDAGVEVLDFSIGEHGYKYRFANRVRTVNSFAASDRLLVHGMHRAVWSTRDLLRRMRLRYPDRAERAKRIGRRTARLVRKLASGTHERRATRVKAFVRRRQVNPGSRMSIDSKMWGEK